MHELRIFDIVKKIIAISLALHLLIFNIGLAVNTHFCGGQVVETSFSIGLHNPDCGMAMMNEGCGVATATKVQVIKTSCCQNQHQILQLDENTYTEAYKVHANSFFFVAFVHTFVQVLTFFDQKLVHNTDYSPPIPDKDIQVLFQTFLI